MSAYFYILEHKDTKRWYVGSKTGQAADPRNFMIDYTTSSLVVNDIIRNSTTVVFSIRKLIIFPSSEQAYNYETRFLKRVGAARHPSFFNGHNNHLLGHDSPEFKQWLRENYDVENTFQIPQVKDKKRETNMKKLGVPYPMMSSKVRDKSKITNLKRYGTENPAQSQQVQTKMKTTNLERYGARNVFASDYGKDRIKRTMLEKYGVDHPMHSVESKEKMLTTNMERYGVTNTFCSPEAKMKITERRNYLLNRPQLNILRAYQKRYKLKFGQGWVRKSDEWIDSLLRSIIFKYGNLE